MKIFAVSDLHLSGNCPKPMDIFGQSPQLAKVLIVHERVIAALRLFLKRADVGERGSYHGFEQIGLPLVAFVERTRRHAGVRADALQGRSLEAAGEELPPCAVEDARVDARVGFRQASNRLSLY